jgi:protein import protein ZIM17
VGLTEIESSYTRGSVSILDNIKGAKNHDRGELYVLMFTCTKCDTRSIRSFTKVAYHEGVVLIKCEGCQNVHLIADNLGWFEDEPTNL